MDVDLPKFHNDYMNSNAMYDSDKGDDDRPSIMGIEDQTHEEYYYNPADEIFVEDCCPGLRLFFSFDFSCLGLP